MDNYISTPDFYREYIEHHGVQGQRWGHRNGPPYPLSREISTGSRLKEGAAGKVSKKTPKSGSGRVTKGFREIKTSEKIERLTDKNKNKEYLKIKPEKELSIEEMNRLVEEEFNKASENRMKKGTPDQSFSKEKQEAYDDVKEWLKEIYLEDNFDGYYDGENPMTGTKGIEDWGDRELISQAKYRLEESGKDKNLSDKEIKQALVDAWNEHYNLPSENPKDKKDNLVTSKEKSKIPSDKIYVKRPDNLSEVDLKKSSDNKENQNKNISPEISKSVDDQKINKDQFGYLNINVKNDKKDTPLHVFTDPDTGGNEDTLRNATKNILSNKQKIKDLAFEAIKEDPYILKDWKPEGMSDKTFLNNLDIRSAYVTPDGGVEISIYGKNDNVQDMLGGHSLDVEFDLNNLKKPSWVAVNG